MSNGNSIFKDKRFWIGVGVGGISAGVVTGLTVNHVVKKREQGRADKKIRDAKQKMQNWIDENTFEVCGNSPEDVRKAVEAHFSALNGEKTVSEANFEGKKSEKEPPDDEKPAQSDDIYAKPGSLPSKSAKNPEPVITKTVVDAAKTVNDDSVEEIFKFSGGKYTVQLKDGGVLSYPIEIFCDKNGKMDDMRVRANLREYDKNVSNLKRVWETFGWGIFEPDPDENDLPTAEEINNWDVSIEDLAKMEEDAGEEPEEMTIAKQRYYDKVEKYKADPSIGAPKIVSKRYFDEDCILEHNMVDYYEVDNVFTDNSDMNSTIDPTLLFGVANGNELFEYKKQHLDEFEEDDRDPDVVYVENFADHSISEITRWHKSYESTRDGSGYFYGDSGENRGT